MKKLDKQVKSKEQKIKKENKRNQQKKKTEKQQRNECAPNLVLWKNENPIK